MKSTIFFSVIMLFAVATELFSNPVDIKTAKTVAQNFERKSRGVSRNVSDVVTERFEGQNSFYVINFREGGWVMVSADTIISPTLYVISTALHGATALLSAWICTSLTRTAARKSLPPTTAGKPTLALSSTTVSIQANITTPASNNRDGIPSASTIRNGVGRQNDRRLHEISYRSRCTPSAMWSVSHLKL